MTLDSEVQAGLDLVGQYMSQCSNWGRWGLDDRRGTLNFVTPEVTKAALQVATSGETVSLARPIVSGAPGPGGMSNLHFMRKTGNEGSGVGSASVSDWLSLCIHGPNTHLDAFSHFSWNGQLYGGHQAIEVVTGAGALAGDVLAMREGLVTRGVLLDIAVLGDRAPEAGSGLSLALLEEVASIEGVQVGAGDVLLVKTGSDSYDRRWNGNDAKTGLELDVLPWLHEREVSLLGSDRDSDARPGINSAVRAPIHTVSLVAMGLWMLDNAYLGDLAERCAALKRWEFCFVMAPLLIDGATGSPVNPLAIL